MKTRNAGPSGAAVRPAAPVRPLKAKTALDSTSNAARAPQSGPDNNSGDDGLMILDDTGPSVNAGSVGCAYVPAHYLRRVARSIVLRAALRGRLSWHVALPLMNRIEGGQS